jgi:hypothetical protein
MTKKTQTLDLTITQENVLISVFSVHKHLLSDLAYDFSCFMKSSWDSNIILSVPFQKHPLIRD